MFLAMGNIDLNETFSGDNQLPSEQQLVRWLVTHLRAALPASWTLEATARELARATARHDVMLVVSEPTGARARIAVEVKRALEPRDTLPLLQAARRYQADDISLLVMAPFIGLRTRDLLASSDINYCDATGNLRLRLDRPALYIERQGAARNPWMRGQMLHTLRGPAAGRVVRALCDYRPPYGVRELATRAETAPGTVAKILALFGREALIRRASRGKYQGKILEVDWSQLLRRWTRDYAFERSNVTTPYLEPRGLDALFAKLKETAQVYAVTGSFASIQFAPIVQPRLMALYVEDIEQAAAEFFLRRAERGANVLLAQPFDSVVFARAVKREGITYAALTQVTADLLTSPGRGPQEGAALLQWMEGHEDVWRE